MPGHTEDGKASLDQNSQKAISDIKMVAPDIKSVDNKNLLLLGAPILEESIEGVLMDKLDNLKLMVERLKKLDAHDALFLLKSCYSIPKLMYFIRAAPTFKCMTTLQMYDYEWVISIYSHCISFTPLPKNF